MDKFTKWFLLALLATGVLLEIIVYANGWQHYHLVKYWTQ